LSTRKLYGKKTEKRKDRNDKRIRVEATKKKKKQKVEAGCMAALPWPSRARKRQYQAKTKNAPCLPKPKKEEEFSLLTGVKKSSGIKEGGVPKPISVRGKIGLSRVL